jgi:hypothetical protein
LQAIVETPHEDGYYYWQILSNEPEQMPFLLDIPADALQGFLDSSDVIEAQTLEDLAEKISVDRSEFLSTIERYNALCDLGFDEDFGKLSDYLIPVRTAPFRAIQVFVGVAVILSGVLCDSQLRVLDDQTGLPIPGLYAAGNTVGRRFGWAYEGTHIGLTNSLAIVHGIVAAESAAASQ